MIDGAGDGCGSEACMYLEAVMTFSMGSLRWRAYRYLSGISRTCTHDPLPILTDPYTLAGLLEFKVLE